MPQVLSQRHHLPIYQPPVWASVRPIGVHKSRERSQTHSSTKGNQTTPIFEWPVDLSSFQGELHWANTETTKTCEGPRICSEPQEVGTHSFSEIRLPMIPFFTRLCSCEAHARQVDQTSVDVPSPFREVFYQCKVSYVHQWIACINGESCETVWVASEVLPNSVPSCEEFSCFLWPVLSLVTFVLFNNVKLPPRVAIFIINFAIKLATRHF